MAKLNLKTTEEEDCTKIIIIRIRKWQNQKYKKINNYNNNNQK